DATLGEEIARVLGAQPSPSDAAHTLDERLPPIKLPSKAEPVIEADHLVEQGRDAYMEGKFAEAINDLTRARDVLRMAVESLEEERKATDTLFRAYMYLAFTLRAQGAAHVPHAVEIMKEGIRTFPTLEPSFSEFGPENVRFFRQVR